MSQNLVRLIWAERPGTVLLVKKPNDTPCFEVPHRYAEAPTQHS